MLDTKEEILRPLRFFLAGFDMEEKRRLELYNKGIEDCKDFYWEAIDLLDIDQQQIFYIEGKEM